MACACATPDGLAPTVEAAAQAVPGGGGNAAPSRTVWDVPSSSASSAAGDEPAAPPPARRRRGRLPGTYGNPETRRRLKQLRAAAAGRGQPEEPHQLAAQAPVVQPVPEAPAGTLAAFLREVGGDSHKALAKLIRQCSPSAQNMPDDTQILNHCLGSEARPSQPLQAETAPLGVDRRKLKQRVEDIAASVHEGSRLCAGSLVAYILAQCSKGHLQPLCAIVFGSYDETSMETRAVFGGMLEPTAILPISGGADAGGAARLQKAERTSEKCKLWQSEFWVAFFCSGFRSLVVYLC